MDAVSAYRDRSAGLVVFGVLQVLIGAWCALSLLGIVAGTPAGPLPPTMAPTLVVYAVAALFFFTVGIGSIRKRRWARALSFAVSAAWLAGGVLTFLVIALLAGRAMRSLTIAAIAFVAVPLILLLFYRIHDVGLTCDARDPKPRWTDRVPVAVLALIVILAFAALTLIASLANPVVPFMTTVLSGAPAAVAMLALAALFAVIAVQLYRLKESAWWMLLLLHILGGLSAAVTMLQSGVGARYAEYGGAAARVTGSPILWAIMAAAWIAYLLYLLYLRRRYFARVRAT